MLALLCVITCFCQQAAGSKLECYPSSVFQGHKARIEYAFGQNIVHDTPLLLFIRNPEMSGDILHCSRMDTDSEAECDVLKDIFRCEMKEDTLSLIIPNATVDMQGTYELHVIHSGTVEPPISCTLVVISPPGVKPDSGDSNWTHIIIPVTTVIVLVIIIIIIIIIFVTKRNVREKIKRLPEKLQRNIWEMKNVGSKSNTQQKGGGRGTLQDDCLKTGMCNRAFKSSDNEAIARQQKTTAVDFDEDLEKFGDLCDQAAGQINSREVENNEHSREIHSLLVKNPQASSSETEKRLTQVEAVADIHDGSEGQRTEHKNRETSSDGQIYEEKPLLPSSQRPSPEKCRKGTSKTREETGEEVRPKAYPLKPSSNGILDRDGTASPAVSDCDSGFSTSSESSTDAKESSKKVRSSEHLPSSSPQSTESTSSTRLAADTKKDGYPQSPARQTNTSAVRQKNRPRSCMGWNNGVIYQAQPWVQITSPSPCQTDV